MILVHNTLSQCALQMYEVFIEISLTVIKLYSEHDFATERQTDGRTDRRTDGQTDGYARGKQYIYLP